MNGGKVESRSNIKDGNGRLQLGEDEVRRIWKDYFEDMHNIDTKEQGVAHICVFDGVQIVNYFERDPIRRFEVEMKVGKLTKGKSTG